MSISEPKEVKMNRNVQKGAKMSRNQQKEAKGSKREQKGAKMVTNYQDAVGRNILTKPQWWS